jgi:hypothetical protein
MTPVPRYPMDTHSLYWRRLGGSPVRGFSPTLPPRDALTLAHSARSSGDRRPGSVYNR